MTKYIIVGTSHISPKSVKTVKSTILREKPDCVAVELCPTRYHAMKHPSRPSNLMFLILSTLQKQLGKSTGIFPGKEMLTAVKAGREVGSQIAFIDKDIREISYQINSLPLAQKLRLIYDSILGFATVKFTDFDLKKIPPEKVITESIKELKNKYPSLYKILIKDRNKYMIHKLRQLKFKKIVVIVGAGHEKELRKCLHSPRKKSKI